MQSKPCVLVFSATDPTCGAGMQADVLTLSALGVHPVSVITAVSVQDTSGVNSLYPLDAHIVQEQAEVAIADIPIAAVKIGLLGTPQNLFVLVDIIHKLRLTSPDLPVICDPVLASGRGDALFTADMFSVFVDALFPLLTLLTPNMHEARKLCTFLRLRDCADHVRANDTLEFEAVDLASTLLTCGCANVLITGTDVDTVDVLHVLYSHEGFIRDYICERLPLAYHGSGCTLAAAISAFVLDGLDLAEAIQKAQDFTWNALNQAFKVGHGQYIPNRLF